MSEIPAAADEGVLDTNDSSGATDATPRCPWVEVACWVEDGGRVENAVEVEVVVNMVLVLSLRFAELDFESVRVFQLKLPLSTYRRGRCDLCG